MPVRARLASATRRRLRFCGRGWPLRRRLKCYVGLRGAKDKLRMLLDRYQFDTCAAVLGVNGTDAEH